MCVVLALLGQLAYNQFESWRRRKAIELHYPELSEHIAQTKWDLVSCGFEYALNEPNPMISPHMKILSYWYPFERSH